MCQRVSVACYRLCKYEGQIRRYTCVDSFEQKETQRISQKLITGFLQGPGVNMWEEWGDVYTYLF